MRFLKVLLAAAMCGALAMGWVNRSTVFDAYTDDTEPLDFSLDGLDLEVEAANRTASPFAVPSAPDTRRVSLDHGFEPSPPAPVSATLGGGSSVISGSVSGPTGAVASAIVLVERHTLESSQSIQVTTDADGAWSITGLKGGRYRVRAFLPGLFASSASEVFFLDAGARVSLPLSVIQARQGPILSFTGPETLEVGAEHTVAVSIGYEVVDAEGRLVLLPSPGLGVVGSLRGSAELLSADQVTTDGYGAARFRVRCNQPAQNVLSVEVNDQRFGFALPACVYRSLGSTAPGGAPGDDTPEAVGSADGGGSDG